MPQKFLALMCAQKFPNRHAGKKQTVDKKEKP
jgi:hypothetical protein